MDHQQNYLQIVLVRHGKPIKNNASIYAGQVRDWVLQYNSAELDSTLKPPAQLLDLATRSPCIICSDLKRSQQSAALLSEHLDAGHAIYREIDLPQLSFPSPKLMASSWVVIFRVLWLLGVSRRCETFREAKKRARFAANQLQQTAQQQGSVVLVGHGLFNRFIAKALSRQGWHGPDSLGSRYWDYAVFKKPTNP